MPFLIWLSIVLFTFYKIFSQKVLNTRFILVLYALKLIAAFLAGIYFMYYLSEGGDTLMYFNRATSILQLSRQEIWDFYFINGEGFQNIDSARTAFFLKCIIPIVWISFKNYWLATLLLSTLSFLCFLILIIRYHSVLKSKLYVLIAAFFFFPSILIWTSGIFKESVSMIFLMIIFLVFLERKVKKSWAKVGVAYWMLSLASLLAFNQIRYFLIIPLLVSISILFIVESSKLKEEKMKWLIASILFLLVIFVIVSNPVLNWNTLPFYLFQAHDNILQSGLQSLTANYYINDKGWLDILINVPGALVNLFLRPFPWEWTKLELVLYSIENITLLMLVIMSFLKTKPSNFNLIILFTLVLALVFIAIATPNFGSLYRYKSLVIPFIMLVSIDNDVLKKLFKFIDIDKS